MAKNLKCKVVIVRPTLFPQFFFLKQADTENQDKLKHVRGHRFEPFDEEKAHNSFPKRRRLVNSRL